MNQPSITPRKAAIHLCISLGLKMDGLAINRQREQCEMLAKYRQRDVVETYVDQSKSTTDRTKIRRPMTRWLPTKRRGPSTPSSATTSIGSPRQPRQLDNWIDASELRSFALFTANSDAALSIDGGRMYTHIKAAGARAEMERKGARQSAVELQRAKQGELPRECAPSGMA